MEAMNSICEKCLSLLSELSSNKKFKKDLENFENVKVLFEDFLEFENKKDIIGDILLEIEKFDRKLENNLIVNEIKINLNELLYLVEDS